MSENKTYRLSGDQALAQARHVRMAPMKTRRVIDLVRGMKANDALQTLAFAPQSAAEPVAKVIASAMSNASHNQQLNPDTLWIAQAYVDEGPTLKRLRPRAQGRAYRIRKRTSHITVVVEAREPITQKQRPARRAGRARSTVKNVSKPASAGEAPTAPGASSPTSTSTQEGAK